MAWKMILVAMKARQGWKRIPPAQRRAILMAAQSSAKKHGPTVAKTLREQGPVVAKRLAQAARQPRKPG
jgi:acyl-CoA reductase-like NAD-dependent aldehyde dehydrogenase